MALVTCPECGHQVSDRAAACPQCGYPVNPEAGEPVLREHLRGRLRAARIGGALMIAFAVFAILAGRRPEPTAFILVCFGIVVIIVTSYRLSKFRG